MVKQAHGLQNSSLAEVLKHLKANAQEAFSSVVITVPAKFLAPQKEATLKAAPTSRLHADRNTPRTNSGSACLWSQFSKRWVLASF